MKLKQNKQSKLVVALSAVILLLVALSATLTFAYFTDSSEKSGGNIAFGHLKIDTNSFAITNAEEHTLVPGCDIKLTGSVAMSDKTNVKAYVRLSFTVEVGTLNESGNFTAISGEYDTQIEDFVAKLGTALGTDWAKSGDYFYLTKSTQGTASESVLNFGDNTTISVPTSLNNDWQGKAVQIKMTVETIQADHVNVDLSGKTGETAAEAIAGATAAWAAVATNTKVE